MIVTKTFAALPGASYALASLAPEGFGEQPLGLDPRRRLVGLSERVVPRQFDRHERDDAAWLAVDAHVARLAHDARAQRPWRRYYRAAL